MTAHARGAPAALVERFGGTGARHHERGNETEEQRRARRHRNGKSEQPKVDANLVEAGNRDRCRGDDAAYQRRGAKRAGDRAGRREQQAFDEHLPDQARARGAESGANRHLAATHAGAREQEARHVDAGREEQQAHGAEQHEERRTVVAEHVVEQRHRPRRPAAVRGRIFLAEACAEGRELTRGVGGRCGRVEPRHGFHEMRRATVLRQVPLQPEPQVDLVGKVKSLRHDAGDRVLPSVDVDGAPDDGWIGAIVTHATVDR